MTNSGTADAVLSQIVLTWPKDNGKLKAVLIGSNVVDTVDNLPPPSATLTTAQLVADPTKRTIKAGQLGVITLQFEKNAVTDVAQYSGTFSFGPDCAVTLNANVCVLGYPYTSANPRTSVVFNESSGLQWVDPAVASGTGGTVQLYATDEHAPLLGVRTATMPVSPINANPGNVANPLYGDPSITDATGRPILPAVYVTDITGVSDNATHTDPRYRAGDWQYGGKPNPPNDIFGLWKGASVVGTGFTTDADPTPKNGWNLGAGSDTPSVGFASLANLGYGTEVRWNVNTLKDKDGNLLIPGHQYRLQFIVHDGDQNKTGGDVGQVCSLLQY